MTIEIMTDPRVRSVAWKDLSKLNAAESVRELSLFVPWLGGSWYFAARGWWIPALGCSFVFFLVGLRLVHDAHHANLGLSRRGHDLVMVVLSMVMLSSMHAVQFNHLRHHRHCLGDEDLEAWSAQLPAYKAILYGPIFPVRLHHAALTEGSTRVRLWTVFEMALAALTVITALWILDLQFLTYHVIVMAIGQCLTSFFAVWTVHNHCDTSHFIARTARGRLKNLVTYNMFLHMEHHLYPGVPTCNLPELSKRLDDAAPELQTHTVF